MKTYKISFAGHCVGDLWKTFKRYVVCWLRTVILNANVFKVQ